MTRLLLSLLAFLALVLGGGCAGDDADDAPPGTPSTSPSADPSAPDETIPVGTDVDVALPPDGQPFLTLTGELIVTSDGTVYRAVEEPMGMVPAPTGGTTWEVAELTSRGFGRLQGFLAEQGFFAPPPDYSGVMVTDVGPNRLIVATADETFEHEAFVDYVDPGTGGEAYARFRTVLDGLRDLPSIVGDEIAEFEPYVPETWTVVDNLGVSASYIDGEVEPWPFAEPAVEGCTSFPDDDVTAGGVDGATGRYGVGDRVLDVEPRFPWDGPC